MCFRWLFVVALLHSISSVVYFVDEKTGDGSTCSILNPCTLEEAWNLIDDNDELRFCKSPSQVMSQTWILRKNNLTIGSEDNIFLNIGGAENPFFNCSQSGLSVKLSNLHFSNLTSSLVSNCDHLSLSVDNSRFTAPMTSLFGSDVSLDEFSFVNSIIEESKENVIDVIYGNVTLKNSLIYMTMGVIPEWQSGDPLYIRGLRIKSFLGGEIRVTNSTFRRIGFEIEILSHGTPNVIITDSTFERCENKNGGAMYIQANDSLKLDISGSMFHSNCAVNKGAGLFVNSVSSLSTNIQSSNFMCNGYHTDNSYNHDYSFHCKTSCRDRQRFETGGLMFINSESDAVSLNIEKTEAKYGYCFECLGTIAYVQSKNRTIKSTISDSEFSHYNYFSPIHMLSKDDLEVSFDNLKMIDTDGTIINYEGSQRSYGNSFTSESGQVKLSVRNSVFNSTVQFARHDKFCESAYIVKWSGGWASLRASQGKVVLDVTNTSVVGRFHSVLKGGCVYTLSKYANIRLVDSEFYGCGACTKGGAVYSAPTSMLSDHDRTDTSSITLQNVQVEDSFSEKDGGALFIKNFDEIKISNSTFIHGVSKGSGGAMFVSASRSVDIFGSSFLYNRAETEGGGAIHHTMMTVAEIFVDSSTFIGNSMTGSQLQSKGGGSIFLDCFYEPSSEEDGESSSGWPVSVVRASLFRDGTSARDGADIWIRKCKLNITDSSFDSSKSSRNGGSLYLEYSQVRIESSQFYRSESIGNGGSVYVVADGSDSLSIATRVYNSTFALSQASQNGGCLFLSMTVMSIFDSTITNCTSKKDGGGVYIGEGGKLYFIRDLHQKQFQVCEAISGYFISPGTTSIKNCVAEGNGGGVYQHKTDSYFQNFQELLIEHNHGKEIGGGLFIGSMYWYPNINVNLRNNRAQFGGGVAVENPETPYVSQLHGQYERLTCVIMENNVAAQSNDIFFISGFPSSESYKIWNNVSSCNPSKSYGTPPVRLQHVDDRLEWVNDTYIEVYSEQEFYIILSALDYFNRPVSRYTDFEITMSSNLDISTPQDKKQELRDYKVKFEKLTLSGQEGTTGQIEFHWNHPTEGYSQMSYTLQIRIVSCPAGKEPNEDQTKCQECPKGYYKFQKGMVSCRSCPVGTICEGNVVTVKKGFWSSVAGENVDFQALYDHSSGSGPNNDHYDPNGNSNRRALQNDDDEYQVKTYQCTNEFCSGGTISTQLRIDSNGGLTSRNNFVIVTNECDGNREGSSLLCGGCKEKFEMFNDECKFCENGFYVLPLFALFVVQLCLFIYIHCTSSIGQNDNIDSSSDDKEIEKKNTLNSSEDYDEESLNLNDSGEDTNSSSLFLKKNDHSNRRRRTTNNSIRLLTDYIQISFLVINFSEWFRSHDDNGFFATFIRFLRSLAMFNPSFGTSDELSDMGNCPFKLQNEWVLVWRILQQVFVVVICLIPLYFTCHYELIKKCFKCSFNVFKKGFRISRSPKIGSVNSSNIRQHNNEDQELEEMNQSEDMIDDDDDDGYMKNETENEENHTNKSESDDKISSSSSSSSSSEKEEELEEGGDEEQNISMNSLPEDEDTQQSDTLIPENDNNNEEEEVCSKHVHPRKLQKKFLKCCLGGICTPCNTFFSFISFRRTLFNLLYMIHTPITMTIFDFLFCASFPHDGHRNIKYSSMECYTPSYFVWMFLFFLPLLFIVILVPFMITCFLCLNKRSLERPRFVKQFGVFYEAYRPSVFYYELVSVFTKICLVFSNLLYNVITISSSSDDYNGLQHIFHAMILGTNFVVHLICQPFTSKFENWLQTMNLLSLLIMISFQEEYYEGTSSLAIIFSLILFSCLCVTMGCCCFCRLECIKNSIFFESCSFCSSKKKRNEMRFNSKNQDSIIGIIQEDEETDFVDENFKEINEMLEIQQTINEEEKRDEEIVENENENDQNNNNSNETKLVKKESEFEVVQYNEKVNMIQMGTEQD